MSFTSLIYTETTNP